MRVELEERGEHTVVRLLGMVTAGDGSRSLSEALTRAETERLGAVIVDASELRHLDSTALGVLVGSMRRLHAEAREICLVNPSPRIALLFQMTSLESLFPTHATVADAIAARHSTPETGGSPPGH
jgi:anti-sigma B factor antagonist